MKAENQKMKQYLASNGIKATPKFLWKGSLKGTWRLYNLKTKWWENYELMQRLTSLGFKDFDGDHLDNYSGNGGMFHIFARFDKTTEFINR